MSQQSQKLKPPERKRGQSWVKEQFLRQDEQLQLKHDWPRDDTRRIYGLALAALRIERCWAIRAHAYLLPYFMRERHFSSHFPPRPNSPEFRPAPVSLRPGAGRPTTAQAAQKVAANAVPKDVFSRGLFRAPYVIEGAG